MTFFCDLLQDKNGNPKPEHKWPSHDYWTLIKPVHELETGTLSKSEDEQGPATSSESEDELETGASSESEDE